MISKYKQKVLEQKLNIYFICEGDKNYNIIKEEVVPANPTCNCYSVAKAFTVTSIGILYDQGLLKPTDLIVDILKKYNEFIKTACEYYPSEGGEGTEEIVVNYYAKRI